MNRKKFIKLSTAVFATPMLSAFSNWPQQEGLKNWAGNLTYGTGNIFYPKTTEEVRQWVKKSIHLRALGTRHCFNSIADSNYSLISSRALNKVISLDPGARSVTVEGGIKYGELCPWLDEKGYALHNLASLPHISVAGSISTATHGSGMGNGNLSSAVNALEIVTADGNIHNFSRSNDGEKFLAVVVGLGAFGMITKVSLDIQPAFLMRQNVYEKMPFEELTDHFDAIMSAGYSVSLFTDWQGNTINEVWIKTKANDSRDYNSIPEFFGGKAATKNMHPIAVLSAENCTNQMGQPGPWYERMPHFKMGFTPSSGKELQTEYFVPHAKAVDAILAVKKLADKIGPHLFISEIRCIAADKFWMSPCRNQDSATIHFTWKQEWEEVRKLLPLIENELAAFQARPHWGKLFTISPKELDSRYEKLSDFKKLVLSYDPKGKFRNDFLNTELFQNPEKSVAKTS
jgi:alditol oxidase